MLALAMGLAAASPALARSGAELPEPDNLVMLGIGVVGLLIGRHAARKRGDDDE